jgi:hypothetical protein
MLSAYTPLSVIRESGVDAKQALCMPGVILKMQRNPISDIDIPIKQEINNNKMFLVLVMLLSSRKAFFLDFMLILYFNFGQ